VKNSSYVKEKSMNGEDPIADSRQKFVDAVRACDIATLVQMHTDETVWMPLNEPSIYGKAELTEWYEEYFQYFRIITFTETERDLTVMDSWAVERWGYMVAIAPVDGGERIRDDGRFLAIWKREPDGIWRIAQAMINSIRPVGSGTSRFLVRMQATKNKAQDHA
jgi:ketosteroid isomerase-like protein